MYGGTLQKIKSHFCHFLPMLSHSPFLSLLPIPITQPHIIIPSPTPSLIHPHILPTTLHLVLHPLPYSFPIFTYLHTSRPYLYIYIILYNYIYSIYTQPTILKKTKKKKNCGFGLPSGKQNRRQITNCRT